MASPVQIKVGGEVLSTIASWGNPVVTHRRRGGCWSLSWDMDVTSGWTDARIVQGASVEAFLGSSRIWVGFLDEFDPGEGSFEARGQGRRFETMVAKDNVGLTTDLTAAINWAGFRGSGVGTVQTWGTVEDNSGEPRTIEELADMWAEENPGKYWYVDRMGAMWQGEDPTEPRWWVMPGTAALGVTDDEYATSWAGWYFDSGTSTYKMVTASTSATVAVEKAVDLTARGAISQAKAQAIVDGFLAQSERRTGWTNPITVSSLSLANKGGGYAGLGMVKAGDMIRLQGFRDQRQAAPYTDAVVGESVWDVDAGEITLKPVDTADRDFSSVVEAAGGKLSL